MTTSEQAVTPEPEADDPPPRKKPLPRAELAFYAFFGGVIAVVLDSAANATPYCDKFGRAINKLIPNAIGDLYQTAAGAAFVILIATVLAHAKRMSDRYETMFFGASILTLLATIVPLADTGDAKSPGGAGAPGIVTPETPGQGFLGDGRVHLAAAQAPFQPRFVVPVQAPSGANARMLKTMPISSCKPSYYGVLGLGSLINNKLRFCTADHRLAEGARVKVLSYWRTWPSQYYYAEVTYGHRGQTLRGWVQAGWKDKPWGYVQLDPRTGAIPAYRD